MVIHFEVTERGLVGLDGLSSEQVVIPDGELN